MKPKNFPGRRNLRRIGAQKRSGVPNPKILLQQTADGIRTKKVRTERRKVK